LRFILIYYAREYLVCSPYAILILAAFTRLSRRAISHATLARERAMREKSSGRFNVLFFCLSRDFMAQAFFKDVKTPFIVLSSLCPRAKVAWLIAAKRGKPDKSG
jgi:hypothetical protein